MRTMSYYDDKHMLFVNEICNPRIVIKENEEKPDYINIDFFDFSTRLEVVMHKDIATVLVHQLDGYIGG